MFSDFDRNDFANLAKIVGIVFFVASFFLPAVTSGYAQSPADYLITSDAYPGWGCAAWSLTGTVMFFAQLSNPDGVGGQAFFFMICGWISPLVLVGFLVNHDKTRRRIAGILPLLMLVPWIFFAWPDPSGFHIRPLLGHYVWTVGSLLIFTPQYARMLGAASNESDEAPVEDRSSNDNVA